MKKIDFTKLNIKGIGGSLNFDKSPHRDWAIIFSVFTVLALFSLCFTFYIFYQIDSGKVFITDSVAGEDGQTLNLEKLEKTVKYYKEKAQTFEAIKSGRNTIPDPSI